MATATQNQASSQESRDLEKLFESLGRKYDRVSNWGGYVNTTTNKVFEIYLIDGIQYLVCNSDQGYFNGIIEIETGEFYTEEVLVFFDGEEFPIEKSVKY
jgi:hypothetical protein